MPNSKLATYNADCKNRNPRRMKIDKITPHYMAGNMGAEQCANYFAASGRSASCNYCIGSDGKIAVCVPEDFRAWTSSSEANDTRAITFECANLDNTTGQLSDACYASLVALCADICERHGINPHYDGTASGSITMHKMFSATSCPGPWLEKKIVSGQFEKDIKAKMQTNKQPETKPIEIPNEVGAVHRLYSGKDHMLTMSIMEAQKLAKDGWKYEGIAFYSAEDGDPVYRLYKRGRHLFTDSEGEKDALKADGWELECIAFYSAGSVPIYRMYNPNNGAHILTASRKEHDALTKAGWFCEGQPLASEAAE